MFNSDTDEVLMGLITDFLILTYNIWSINKNKDERWTSFRALLRDYSENEFDISVFSLLVIREENFFNEHVKMFEDFGKRAIFTTNSCR